MEEKTIIEQTQKWIKSVVIDCNFCPFASKALLKQSINYIVIQNATLSSILEHLLKELFFLDTNTSIETSFIILPNEFSNFENYLHLVKKAEKLLIKEGYDGVYQIASFHPDYCFSDAPEDDPANYTNRSIYPMLHILREDSISKALSLYKEPEKIPENNISFARQKGLMYMQMLRISCM